MSFADLIAKKSGTGEDEYPESGLPEPSRAGSMSGSLEAFIQKHGHVTEEYKFYNGEITLRFNVDEHCYYRVGELGNLTPVNGTTNTVGIIDKSFMLTPWAAKMAIQKLLRIMPTEMVQGVIRIKPLTFEEFTVIALEAKGAHKDKLDEASDIGHMAHKCLEESIIYAMQNDPDKIVRKLINEPADEQAKTAANNALVCMSNHNIRWMETETKIYSREYDYAGTMDGLALCDSCNDKACCPVSFKDRICLIDWKSSNHLKIEYLFQTASYKKAKMEERPDLKIEDIFLFRLGKSDEEAGKFEPWHMTPEEFDEDFQGFVACLNLTRLVDSVEERMKKQKSSIRAIKKEQRETAKALAKEQEKLQKALDKAAKKLAAEAEKKRIKEEAKLKREETKAAKKSGIKPGSVRAKYEGVWHVTQPGEPLFSTAVMAAEQSFTETGWEPIEGRDAQGGSAADCKPVAPSEPEGSIPSSPTISEERPYAALKKDFDEKFDKIVAEMNGGEQCTSTSKPNPAATPLVTTTPTPENSSPSPTTVAEETLHSESTTSTVETIVPVATRYAVETKEEETFALPFKLPMEG